MSDAFPLVRPVVLADLPVSGDEHLSTMFVSPHEFGVVGAVTAQRQLVVWDSTISAVSRRTSHEEAVRHSRLVVYEIINITCCMKN